MVKFKILQQEHHVLYTTTLTVQCLETCFGFIASFFMVMYQLKHHKYAPDI